ncbi:MAG TPA: efflux RND transporter permease subunit [Bacteroidota bacterium]|nr:efflux RND transporter permease subunit [Bacteroidota bacterium]
MRIWDKAVDNKVAVYILMLLIVVVGWSAYLGLPREASPDISIPLVFISVPYIGASPSDIEGLVTQPLEKELKSLKDIKHITSVSKEGLSSVQVEFTTNVPVDEALRRVRDKVNSTRSQLPADILEPIVNELNLSEFPIMYVNIGGSVGLARLKSIAEDMQDKIEAIPGVLRADLNGGIEPEVQVNADVYRLKAYQLSFDDLVNAIRSENLSIPGGAIDDKQTSFSVRIPGEFKEVKPLEDIVVKIRSGKPIYLRDVAKVDYSFEDRQTYARLNGNEVVSLAVRKRAGENLIRIADETKLIVDQSRAVLPAGISIDVSNDVSTFIRRSVKELENSIMTGMFLVVCALFMFFGLKNALLISTAIPLSMFIGFMVLAAFDITLNFVVLFALVLALGILVDDAIVVIENIYRHQQEYDKSPAQAAKDAATEVALPVATSTFTTLAGFIPLLFWPGVVGDFMRFLPLTLIITLSASLFVAFIISPVQGAQWINYKKEIAKAKQNREHPTWYKKYNPFTIIYHEVDEKFFPWMQSKYVRTLHWTLMHKGVTVSSSIAFLVLVIVLFGVFNKGVEFFPDTEPNQVTVSLETPVGTSLDVTNALTETMERRLREVGGNKDIEFVVGNVGTSTDFFDFGGSGVPNKSIVAVNFFEKNLRHQNTFRTMEEIRAKTADIAGAEVRVEKEENGPPVGAPVSIEVSGDDYAELVQLSKQIKEKIRSIPNLVDLKDNYNSGKPEIDVVVDREKAGMFWTSTGQIAGTVRGAISGIEASKYRVGKDEYKIRVRLQEDQRQSAEDLQNVTISFMNMQGQLLSIPLSSVADITRTTGVSEIRRKDQNRVITITADVQGRLSSAVLEDVKKALAGFEVPAGYAITFSGEDEEQNKAAAFLTNAFIGTLLLVFLILVTEFNSVKVPFVIMLSVLLSLIGVFIGLLVTGRPFSIIMTGVGVIALAGIVVRNAIVLLDFAKRRRDEGMPMDEALLEAGRVRLRPVMLTAAATVLGIIPLATGVDFDWVNLHFIIGAESAGMWAPLGIAVIFGLSISTFLTLVVVPTFYSLLEEWTERTGSFVRRLFAK